MENREYLNRLFDIYKELLTEIEQVTFINYYKEDLSLSEIANLRGVSKSSVGKTLTTVEEKLKDYENKLNVLKIKTELTNLLSENNIDLIKKKVRELI